MIDVLLVLSALILVILIIIANIIYFKMAQILIRNKIRIYYLFPFVNERKFAVLVKSQKFVDSVNYRRNYFLLKLSRIITWIIIMIVLCFFGYLILKDIR
jgi:hypothetical protein